MARRRRIRMATPGPAASPNGALTLRARAGVAAREGWARTQELTLAASEAPLTWLARLLALNVVAAAAFTALGLAAGDQALLFRELMPGTLLSFAQLGLIATAAWLLHRASPGDRPWHGDLWGLIAVVFWIFAFDEITQTSQFAGTLLNEGAGLEPASGFNDVGAVILTLTFAAAALVVAPRALVLLRQPAVLALLAAGAALGAASQGLDSFVEPTRWEFVAEESLKLCAEAILIGALLLALRDARRS